MTLEARLKSLAIEEGCIRAGITHREIFSEAPPSADMRYLKPWANTVVSFALSTGADWIEERGLLRGHHAQIEEDGRGQDR